MLVSLLQNRVVIGGGMHIRMTDGECAGEDRQHEQHAEVAPPADGARGARPINGSDNGLAGSRLGVFLGAQRLLDRDPSFVAVTP